MIYTLTKKEINTTYGGSQVWHINCEHYDPIQKALTFTATCGGVAAFGNLVAGPIGLVFGFSTCMGYAVESIYFHVSHGYETTYTGYSLKLEN